jgi:hypothetical protein
VVVAAISVATVVALLVLRRWRIRIAGKAEEEGESGRAISPWDLVLVVFSVILIASSLIGGLRVLRVEGIPSGDPPEIGFLPPASAQPGRGVAVGMSVSVRDCNESAHVRLVASGTAEYWIDNASRLGRDPEFKLSVPESSPKNIEIGTTYFANDVVNPAKADSDAEGVSAKRIEANGRHTVITGRVPNWGKRLGSVVVSFDADWLLDRGLGTCYVRLPTMSGSSTAFAAELAAGRARESVEDLPPVPPQTPVVTDIGSGLVAIYRVEEEIVHGNASVLAQEGGDVLSDESLPPPDTHVNGNPTWVCRSRPSTSGVVGETPPKSVPDFLFGKGKASGVASAAEIERELGSTCDGFAVVAEQDADEQRDLVILLIGIGISLGLGVLIDLFMDWQGGRPVGRHRRPSRPKSVGRRRQRAR